MKPPAAAGGADRPALQVRLNSFRHAGRGLRRMLRREPNARLHLVATVATGIVAAWLRIPAGDWRWLVAAATPVWVAEAINTAIEALCDRLHPGFDPAIGAVKGMAAAAVLLASIGAALIGITTLGPALLRLVPGV